MTITPPQPPVMQLYQVLSSENLPPCTREQHPFGFHDDWPKDMAEGEFILIELSDGSCRVAVNEVGHMMLMDQLYRLSAARPEVSFQRFRCQRTEAPS